MKRNVEEINVRAKVRDCLTNILDDYESGIRHKCYVIFVPVMERTESQGIRQADYTEIIRRPELVHKSMLSYGIDSVVDSFSREVMKNIYCKI